MKEIYIFKVIFEVDKLIIFFIKSFANQSKHGFTIGILDSFCLLETLYQVSIGLPSGFIMESNPKLAMFAGS